MKVELHYGRGHVALDIPRENIRTVIRPWNDTSAPDNRTMIQETLSELATAQFRRAIHKKRLCVLVGDGTRDMPLEEITGELLQFSAECAFVRFMICTGTHDAETPENAAISRVISAAAESICPGRYDIRVHHCRQDTLLDAGTTNAGTRVLFNEAVNEADVFCVLSDVKFHYFAGYSNPVKNFVPGLCAYETAEGNHSLALDDRSICGVHPWHAEAQRRNNPLACDQVEAMRLITGDRAVFALVTISTSGKIQWARFGRAEVVSAEAFGECDRRNAHTVTPADRLVVSPGGLPNDVDLYISQRALELTKRGVVDGGEVLFISACPKGIGHERTMENFYNRLTRPIDEIMDSVKGDYKLFSHKPYRFAQMIQRLDKIWMHSEIEDSLVSAAHLYPTNNPQAVVDDWIEADGDVQILIVDGANKVALYS